MTTAKFRERLIKGDHHSSEFTDFHFLALSLILNVGDETTEADEQFLTAALEEIETGTHWHRLKKTEREERAKQVVKQLRDMGFEDRDIPPISTISYRITRALSQVEYYSQVRGDNAWFSGILSLAQMVQAAKLLTENPQASKIRLDINGKMRVE